MKAILATIKISAEGKLNSGIPAFFGSCLIKIIYTLPIIFIWRSLAESGADLGGFSLDQLLTYTCVSMIFSSQLNVRSSMVSWHYEGQIIDLCKRPQTIPGQLVMTTAGGWLPELFFFSLPLFFILPLVYNAR